SVASTDGVLRLTQAGPSALRYGLRIPDDATLRFTPELHPASRAAGRSVRMQVTLEMEGNASRVLWAETLDAHRPVLREVSVTLGAPAGTAARLSLEVADVPENQGA